MFFIQSPHRIYSSHSAALPAQECLWGTGDVSVPSMIEKQFRGQGFMDATNMNEHGKVVLYLAREILMILSSSG